MHSESKHSVWLSKTLFGPESLFVGISDIVSRMFVDVRWSKILKRMSGSEAILSLFVALIFRWRAASPTNPMPGIWLELGCSTNRKRLQPLWSECLFREGPIYRVKVGSHIQRLADKVYIIMEKVNSPSKVSGFKSVGLLSWCQIYRMYWV